MKAKCKQCGAKHDLVRIDLMNAIKFPKPFCSDECERDFKIAEDIIRTKLRPQKQTASIHVFNPDRFKKGMTVKLGGTVCEIESIDGNVVEVFRYQTVN